MSSAKDKVEGVANEIAGKGKQAVGDLTGDKKLHAEGVTQEVKGDFQKAAGKVKDAIKKAVDNG
jgi:uncharacterized protein YjbJ (UPF0337 family)